MPPFAPSELVAYGSTSSVQGRVGAGFVPFIALSVYGLRLLFRGLRGDIYDWLGHAPASRGWFIVGGLLFQLPLIAWTVFLIHRGWFTQLTSG